MADDPSQHEVPDRSVEPGALGLPSLAARPLAARLRLVAARRVGAALGLWGPPGIGKSHQAHAALATLGCATATVRAADAPAVWAAAVPRARREPPWAESVLERIASGENASVGDAAGAMLARWSEAAPFVLCVEDAHDTGDPQGALLAALASAAPRVRGCGLLVTSRLPLGDPFTTWRVEPLDPAATGALVASALGVVPPAEAVAWIAARAEGNPLLALEYLRYLRREGALWDDGSRWRWRPPTDERLPRTLEALVERQLQALDADAVCVLEAAAYLPRGAGEEALRVASGVVGDAFVAAAAGLARHGLLVAGPDGVREFGHAAMRHAVRARSATVERGVMARRLLEAFASRPRIAVGLVDDEVDDARLLPTLVAAADAAEAAGASLEAARLRARAARRAERAERASLALRAARGLLRHDRDEAIRVAEIAVDAGAGSEAAHLLAGALITAGRNDDAAAVLARSEGGSASDASWVRRSIVLHGGAGDPRTAATEWREHPELHADPDPELAYAASFALVVLGAFDEAERVAAPALARAHLPLDRCRLLMVLGLVHASRPGADGAERAFDEAVALARGEGLGGWLAAALHNRSALLEELGRDDDMLADVEEALGVYAEVGDAVRFASTQTKLARHLADRGDFDRAEELLLSARETLSRATPGPFLVTCECVLATLYDVWRPPHAGALALGHANAALKIARSLGVPNKVLQALAASASVEAEHGDPVLALERASELLASVGEGDARALVDSLVPIARALAAVGRSEEAIARLEWAGEVAARLPSAALREGVGLELDRVRGDFESLGRRRAWFASRGLHGMALRAARAEAALRPTVTAVTTRDSPTPTSFHAREASQHDEAIWLDVLGAMRLRRAERVEIVQGERRRALLALLLEARLLGREGVERLELADLLYPSADDDRAGDALKQLVYQLRRRWGPGLVVLQGDGYALGAVRTDAEAFLAGGDTRLWRGPCLPDERVDRARALLVRRLVAAVGAATDDDPAEAARLARILLEAEPYDPEALRLALQALRAEGDLRALEVTYRVSRARLAEVGEELPERWSGFLAPQAQA